METLILVGMGASDVSRRDELLNAAPPQANLAFLQLGDPSLSTSLTYLADQGAQVITLVGIDLGPLPAPHSWLRRIAAHWWRERAGTRPEIHIADRYVSSLTEFEVQIDEASSSARPITGAEPGLTSQAWEQVSAYRHQVLLCRGPRCSAQGAEDNLRALIMAMIELNLEDNDVLLVQTSCQFPCNQAPVMNVQPDDIWYGCLDEFSIRTVVSEHLAAGRPVRSHRLLRYDRRCGT